MASTEAEGRELRMLDPSFSVQLVGTGDRSTTLRRIGAEFQASNVVTSSVFQTAEAAFTRSIEYDGPASGTNMTSLDYIGNNLFSLPDGNSDSRNCGSQRHVASLRTDRHHAMFQSNGIELGTGRLTLQNGSNTEQVDVSEHERLVLQNLQSLGIVGPLAIGNQTLTLGNSGGLINLSNTTQLAGGTLQSVGPIALGSGELLSGFGTIAGRLSGESGSIITAQGALSIG